MKLVRQTILGFFGLLAFSTLAANASDFINHVHSQRTGPSKCLGIHEDNLTHPFMAPCANFAAELWSVETITNGAVKFRSKRTGESQCLGVAAADNSKIIVAPCGGFKNQAFLLEPSKTAGYSLVDSSLTGPNQCLGIAEAGGAVELDMRPCGNFPGQNWSIAP